MDHPYCLVSSLLAIEETRHLYSVARHYFNLFCDRMEHFFPQYAFVASTLCDVKRIEMF
jgi:hypothetical protein